MDFRGFDLDHSFQRVVFNMASVQSIEDLEKQLTEYNAQLEMVEGAIRDDPTSTEFGEIKKNLIDVMKSTKELLLMKKEGQKKERRFPDIQQCVVPQLPLSLPWPSLN